MSLATFKKKSINRYSSATKHSGKPTNEYWLYPGPYGRQGSLSSTIYKASLAGIQAGQELELNLCAPTAQNAGFSINGPYRQSTNRSMCFSKSGTPYRGAYPMGNGGTHGRYPDGPDNQVMNIAPVQSGVAVQNAIVKPSVLSTKGMLERRYRWIHSGQYPNYWVQPVYTGNQTDTASQGLYLQRKSAANDCHYDVNDSANYVYYFKTCGGTGCQSTPARGYTMGIQQANAPYTKTLHRPKDSSAYTLRIQRQCQNPVGLQKPFPYAVQTGTGVLTGGISVSRVASACNTSNPVVTPPDWYTEVTPEEPTLEAQLRARLKPVTQEEQDLVFQDVFLDGTTA